MPSLAALLGLLVARMLVQGLLAIGPTALPRIAEIGIDWQVAMFTLGVSLAASLLFGLAPAVQASRGDLRDALQGRRSRGLAVAAGACAACWSSRRSRSRRCC